MPSRAVRRATAWACDSARGAGTGDGQDRPLHGIHGVASAALDLEVGSGDGLDRDRRPSALQWPTARRALSTCHGAIPRLLASWAELPRPAAPTLISWRSWEAMTATIGTGSTPLAMAWRSSRRASPACPDTVASATRKPVASTLPP